MRVGYVYGHFQIRTHSRLFKRYSQTVEPNVMNGVARIGNVHKVYYSVTVKRFYFVVGKSEQHARAGVKPYARNREEFFKAVENVVSVGIRGVVGGKSRSYLRVGGGTRVGREENSLALAERRGSAVIRRSV